LQEVQPPEACALGELRRAVQAGYQVAIPNTKRSRWVGSKKREAGLNARSVNVDKRDA